MLTPLDLKLFRDLGRMKGQIVAVSLVMACGLAMMIMTRSIILTLERTRDAYYQRQRLADVFGSLKRAPKSLADRMAALPGVAAVERSGRECHAGPGRHRRTCHGAFGVFAR